MSRSISCQRHAPAEVDHYCARCLGKVSYDAQECPGCSRRFVGRGRFDRLAGPRPKSDFLPWMQARRA